MTALSRFVLAILARIVAASAITVKGCIRHGVALKNRALQYPSADGKIIALLVALIAFLAVGGVKLNHVVAADMLRADAHSTSSSWVATLMESVDIPTLIAGAPASGESKHLLESATKVSDIYRFRIWNKKGALVFSSDRTSPVGVQLDPAERSGQRIAKSLSSGAEFTETHVGPSPTDPDYFAESYIPVLKNGAAIGVFEIYLDQTTDYAFYRKSFLRSEFIIAFAVLLAGAFPGVLVYRKMVAHRTAQAEALFLAEHDTLTGVANRRRLGEAAEGALAFAVRNKTYIAALLIDLDRFKSINDSFGHEAGDEVLRALALRLNSAVRAEDVVARLGGDEFVILQVGMAQPDGAQSLATRLMEILSVPYRIGDLKLDCEASIGVAIAPPDARDWDSLLGCADAALYKAKAEGGNTVSFYEPGMDAIFRERRRLETDLRRALDTNAFQLAYQPLFSFHDKTLLGFETLLRWPDGWAPKSPAEFIPVAEESGLIVPIGAWVLRMACKTAAAWTKPLKVAVNLSPVQFRHGDIVATVKEALEISGLDPARLELEVTEGIWIQNSDAVLEQLAHLRAIGISIALDDFGTGYSSLAYLWKFPFDVVKIDRSFVTAMQIDPKADAIVKTIVALGKTLFLTVTAEGVETSAQAQTLSAAGCDHVQGYLFGRPLSATSASALIQNDRENVPGNPNFTSLAEAGTRTGIHA
jgi:diguanylate cyclase (GGDEF)-like protein